MLEIDEEHPDSLLRHNTTERIVGATFEVHRELGYGFLERVYERALQVELIRRGSTAQIEKRVQVQYKDVVVGDSDSDCRWLRARRTEGQSFVRSPGLRRSCLMC